jgi:hypothetical protein
MDLYLDRLPKLDSDFRKEAGFAARVSEQPENWPQEINSEIYKQLPFLSDYDVNVNLDRVDPQRGFAFGYADVASKTERPEVEHTEMGIPHIRIPIVVHERAVKPFSVFLDGERVCPLNEERIRETLFNPASFDISQSMPRDPSLVEATMPPTRSGAGYGGEYKMASAQEKTAAWWPKKKPNADALLAKNPEVQKALARIKGTLGGGVEKGIASDRSAMASLGHRVEEASAKVKKASVLHVIAPTIREKDAEAFIAKVAADPTLRAGFKRAGILEDLVEVFDLTKRASADERLAAIAGAIEPTVITLHKMPGGDFLVKSANSKAVTPKDMEGQVVPGEEAGQAIGQENAQAMQPGQTATITADPVTPRPEVENKAKVIEEFGEYKVQDMMGNTIMGWVFPQTLAWDGSFSPQPIALFSNGSAYAMQDAIAGEMVGKGTNLPADRPLGDGVFYAVKGGDAVVTGPVTVKSMLAGPDGQPQLVCHDAFGNQFQVSMSEVMTNPQRIADNEYALPTSWKFMRLNNQTQLVPDPVQMNKTAAALALKDTVTLWYNGGFNIDGGCGLAKLAAQHRFDMSPVDAEFMLGLLGMDGLEAKTKVAEARKKGSVKLAGLRPITLLSERYEEATKVASALMKEIPDLRRDLIKEAAALQEQGTVNNILALNFINPENLTTFIEHIPELEGTAEKLAEMLLYNYLGMNELPEGAIERAMKNVEEVVRSLKGLAESGGQEQS